MKAKGKKQFQQLVKEYVGKVTEDQITGEKRKIIDIDCNKGEVVFILENSSYIYFKELYIV